MSPAPSHTCTCAEQGCLQLAPAQAADELGSGLSALWADPGLASFWWALWSCPSLVPSLGALARWGLVSI